MKKLFSAATLIFLIFAPLFAQNRDYRQVIFGNNYEQIKEINADEFFKQYPQVKDEGAYMQFWELHGSYLLNWDNNRNPVYTEETKNYTRVYEQKIGEIIFYRILYSKEKLTNEKILDWKKRYIEQYVFMKEADKKLCAVGEYPFGTKTVTQWGNNPVYFGLEIIQRNNEVKGLLKYSLSYSTRDSVESIYNEASYYLFDDIKKHRKVLNETLDEVDLSLTSKVPVISIETSRPLVDSKRPFMYTIQNAFDGNPATSYVEDTEDDLFKIRGDYSDFFTCSKISFINGYAASEALFRSNNRIKLFFYTGAAKSGYEALDKKLYEAMTVIRNKPIQDTREKQVITFMEIPLKSFYFSVDAIYKGSKYSDTCIAELDIFTQEYGWLFGGSNE